MAGFNRGERFETIVDSYGDDYLFIPKGTLVTYITERGYLKDDPWAIVEADTPLGRERYTSMALEEVLNENPKYRLWIKKELLLGMNDPNSTPITRKIQQLAKQWENRNASVCR